MEYSFQSSITLWLHRLANYRLLSQYRQTFLEQNAIAITILIATRKTKGKIIIGTTKGKAGLLVPNPSVPTATQRTTTTNFLSGVSLSKVGKKASY